MALAVSDGRCDELERESELLEGKVADMQQQLTGQAEANELMIGVVNNQAQELEVFDHVNTM